MGSDVLADKCLTTGSQRKKKFLICSVGRFWDFCCVNTPAVANFRLSSWHFNGLTKSGKFNKQFSWASEGWPRTPQLEFLTLGHSVRLFLQMPGKPLKALETDFWKWLGFVVFKSLSDPRLIFLSQEVFMRRLWEVFIIVCDDLFKSWYRYYLLLLIFPRQLVL